jgi:hypothetical protein
VAFLRGSYFFMEVLRLIIGDDGVSRTGNVSSYPCGVLPSELRCHCESGIMTLTAGGRSRTERPGTVQPRVTT